jgi:rubrerythrin
MTKVQRILSFAMRMEKDASDFYSFYMDKVQSETTKKLFRELAAIEVQHFNFIKSKFDEMGFTEPPTTISWVVDNTSTAIDPHILADISDVSGNPDSDISDLTVIRMAYLIENDFANFYKNAVNSVDDPAAKKTLEELSAWEEQHKSLFYKRYQELLKKHWSDITSIIFP